jgi:hypothetical protein
MAASRLQKRVTRTVKTRTPQNVGGTIVLIHTVASDCLYSDVTIHTHNATGGTTFMQVFSANSVNNRIRSTINLGNTGSSTSTYFRLTPGFTLFGRTNSLAAGMQVTITAVEVLSE